jgi:hypothetical protein
MSKEPTPEERLHLEVAEREINMAMEKLGKALKVPLAYVAAGIDASDSTAQMYSQFFVATNMPNSETTIRLLGLAHDIMVVENPPETVIGEPH